MRKLSEYETQRIKEVMKGMRSDELLVAVKAIPTTVLSQEIERRDGYVSATLTNIQMILSTITDDTSIVECQKAIRAIRAIAK